MLKMLKKNKLLIIKPLKNFRRNNTLYLLYFSHAYFQHLKLIGIKLDSLFPAAMSKTLRK